MCHICPQHTAHRPPTEETTARNTHTHTHKGGEGARGGSVPCALCAQHCAAWRRTFRHCGVLSATDVTPPSSKLHCSVHCRKTGVCSFATQRAAVGGRPHAGVCFPTFRGFCGTTVCFYRCHRGICTAWARYAVRHGLETAGNGRQNH